MTLNHEDMRRAARLLRLILAATTCFTYRHIFDVPGPKTTSSLIPTPINRLEKLGRDQNRYVVIEALSFFFAVAFTPFRHYDGFTLLCSTSRIILIRILTPGVCSYRLS
jgi:hypothetical protein